MTARELGSESVDSRSVVMALRSPIALATRARSTRSEYFGMAILARMPTIVIAARSSMSVKADRGCRAGRCKRVGTRPDRPFAGVRAGEARRVRSRE
jgi:hypothetical protein